MSVFAFACVTLCLHLALADKDLLELATSLGATECVRYFNVTGLRPAFTYNGKLIYFIVEVVIYNVIIFCLIAQCLLARVSE